MLFSNDAVNSILEDLAILRVEATFSTWRGAPVHGHTLIEKSCGLCSQGKSLADHLVEDC